ncbi:unnamed protein product [Chrysoparadoxa australica]
MRLLGGSIEVSESPFSLEVTEAAADAATSYAHGSGATYSTHFKIQVLDRFRNRQLSASRGSELKVELVPVALPEHRIAGVVDHLAEGEYLITYAATTAGDYTVFATLHDQAIEGSPWKLEVVPAALAFLRLLLAAPESSESDLLSLAPTQVTTHVKIHAEQEGDPEMLMLQAEDAWGNVEISGGRQWFVEVEGETLGMRGVKYFLSVSEAGPGSYLAVFVPPKAGPYSVSVDLVHELEGLTARTYANSQLLGPEESVEIQPAVDAAWESGIRSVQWSGYLRVPASEDFEFSVHTGSLGAGYLWLNSELLESGVGVSLVSGRLYRIKLNYTQSGEGEGYCRLMWSSPSVRLQVVPSSYLHPN